MLESKIYPVNTAPNLNELADIMVCEIGSYPATYLGMPLRAKYKAKEARNKVIKQVRKLAYAILVHGRKDNTNQQCFGQYSKIWIISIN